MHIEGNETPPSKTVKQVKASESERKKEIAIRSLIVRAKAG